MHAYNYREWSLRASTFRQICCQQELEFFQRGFPPPSNQFENKTASARTFRQIYHSLKSLTRRTARENNDHSDGFPSRQLHSRYQSAECISPALSQFAFRAAAFPRAEGDEIRQNIVIAITAEHWAGGKDGIGLLSQRYYPLPGGARKNRHYSRTLKFRLLGDDVGFRRLMTNGSAIFALLESPWSIPGHRRRCRGARIRVHREEKSPRRCRPFGT